MNGLLTRDHCPDQALLELPERVIQIGEGNFLRGFVDWMIHQLNKHNLFRGRIVVVAPRPTGRANIERLNAQDGLFTVWLRGVRQGVKVDERDIVSSVSRGLDPYQQWDEFLACAENPTIEIVVSNTTESGIQYLREDYQEGVPLQSFPGKLTAYLYHRYNHFQGSAAAGMTLVPCELLDDNGDRLRDVVLQHARDWGLPTAFCEWVQRHNHFCNTLVDRIVTGFPTGEDAQELLAQLPYRDALVTVGEPFHLWAIEADERLRTAWPFEQIGLNVAYVSDIRPYRTQKVRILNGLHTAMCAAGVLLGVQTVREAVNHPVLGPFVHRMLDEEIVPTLLASRVVPDRSGTERFAAAVFDRFENPFIRHELKSIALNGLSKIRVRLLPTVKEFHAHRGRVPLLLAAAFAAQLLFYREAAASQEVQDDPALLERVSAIWRSEPDIGLRAVVEQLLGDPALWGEDLNQIDGLCEAVVDFIGRTRAQGLETALESLIFSMRETSK
ncbi:tagaturonate reductase [Alicyclobacillus cycloheptanicus]|uniref:Tagaturonate reductase n=1 Tax=Alicyclobacillus cycloheptanicus TaxID=1457 RepID=A0ABT9XEV3_9BACL|nr:tagaturonate reductase [Alicyclobacillus cycloheptanicus]MDQ0188830.1 tagaturonate reductase [Alicyclobacillus cycloheptanicus]WDM00523.1 tagaturonate reductase [Alicyclobacillus cycloheptanicus]